MPTTRQRNREAKMSVLASTTGGGTRRSKRISKRQQQSRRSSDDEAFRPSDDESTCEGSSCSSNDSQPVEVAHATRRTPRTAKRSSTRHGQLKRPVTSDPEEKDSKQRPPTKIGRSRRSRQLIAAHTNTEENSPSDDNAETDEEQPAAPRSNKKGQRPSVLSETSDDDMPSPNRRGTPSRSASRKGIKRFTAVASLSTTDEDEEEERIQAVRKRDDEDESYQNEDSGESDTDEGKNENEEFADTESEDETLSKPRRTSAANNIDNDNFLDSDESSADEQTPKRPRRQSGQLEIRPSPKGLLGLDMTDEFTGDEMAVESVSPQKALSHCNSTCDAITMEPLPSKHICYYPPDQGSCQCFALSTLHKIALSGQRQYDENGKVTFKQPPHFRDRASEELLYQIISRFGRAATNVFGGFYTGKKDIDEPAALNSPNSSFLPVASNNPNSSAYNEFSYMVNYDGTLVNNEIFLEQVNDYMNRYMGSKDIYCCPLCYSEAHRRFENVEAGSDDPVQSEVSLHEGDFPRNDPLQVLGCPDRDCFRLASTFCFRKQVQLKRHLKQDHRVDLNLLDGTDLFKRFMFRASDGLLQRYLDRGSGSLKGRPRQGLMAQYWSSGNNEIFLFLIHLIERCRLMRDTTEQEDADEESREFIEAREFVDEMLEYQESFRGRAGGWWEAISAPYSKASLGEVENFIDDDNNNEVSEVEEAVPHHVMQRTIHGDDSDAVEDEIVSQLRARRFCAHSDDGSSSCGGQESEEGNGEAAFDEDEDVDDFQYRAYYSEESSEEDDWMKERRQKRRTPTRKKSPVKQPLRIVRETMKRLGKQKKTQGENQMSPQTTTESTPPTKKKRRRIVLDDSDDD